jgi:hypothetical protein
MDLRHAIAPSWLPVARRLDKRLAERASARRRHDDPDARAELQRVSSEIIGAIVADEPFVERFFTRSTPDGGQRPSR